LTWAASVNNAVSVGCLTEAMPMGDWLPTGGESGTPLYP
jgi:hypothetical protein